MNIFGTGIDIIEIYRIEKVVSKHPKFLDKYFTSIELEYFASKKNNYQNIAGYFAAKEAVSKALGTGFREYRLIDIEIVKNRLNKPEVVLHHNAKKIIIENKINHIYLSISHSKDYAIANAIATFASS
ncbi:holo-ACP synthase [Alkalibaculum sp. M08DMB]|uniref:Holo-[acyl-carrier-protein] synthase n=1 Tax=Alkalibaculum sporogenes TaxID=2655001 RepID=A0A6A7KC48_9FIRM|nr:holo-ACP synthase [Alkalibaculum sporogenes]MPW26583.1 holo-ACP synthase [Alkalibaculum sporogenes]